MGVRKSQLMEYGNTLHLEIYAYLSLAGLALQMRFSRRCIRRMGKKAASRLGHPHLSWLILETLLLNTHSHWRAAK